MVEIHHFSMSYPNAKDGAFVMKNTRKYLIYGDFVVEHSNLLIAKTIASSASNGNSKTIML
jgi:hypothetical protein